MEQSKVERKKKRSGDGERSTEKNMHVYTRHERRPDLSQHLPCARFLSF
jgi:hypothetical protein